MFGGSTACDFNHRSTWDDPGPMRGGGQLGQIPRPILLGGPELARPGGQIQGTPVFLI